MRSFTRLGSDGRFQTRQEYPKDVWLEAIVNAAVHRSYNLKNQNIYVKLYDNKMTIESPGGFFPPTTAATVYETHNPRNPFLMWGLYYFDFVKCAFEGTRRMREVMMEADLPPPEFAQNQSGVHTVRVTLKNNIEFRKAFLNSKTVGVVSERIYSTLTDEEKVIINYVAEKGHTNVKQIVFVLDVDWQTAKNYITNLVDAGILEVKGNDSPRNGNKRYILKAKNAQKKI